MLFSRWTGSQPFREPALQPGAGAHITHQNNHLKNALPMAHIWYVLPREPGAPTPSREGEGEGTLSLGGEKAVISNKVRSVQEASVHRSRVRKAWKELSLLCLDFIHPIHLYTPGHPGRCELYRPPSNYCSLEERICVPHRSIYLKSGGIH